MIFLEGAWSYVGYTRYKPVVVVSRVPLSGAQSRRLDIGNLAGIGVESGEVSHGARTERGEWKLQHYFWSNDRRIIRYSSAQKHSFLVRLTKRFQ